MRAVALAALALALGASSIAAAQDAGARRDAGVRDAGVRDAGVRDAGAHAGVRDAGIEGGAAVAPSDEQPPVELAPTPLPEGHEPEVELTIEPPPEGAAAFVTGDLVPVRITVRLPEGDDVALPRQTFGPFELHDQRHSDRAIDGGRRELVFEIDLLALEPGEHELPPLRLRVVTAGGDVGSVLTEPQRVVVESLIANEPDAQPRPPTEPVAVMQDDYTLAWVLGILGGMLLTALLTWMLARWWSRRPKKVAPPPPPRPAWETALTKLQSLHARRGALIADGKHVELVDGVSDALREYFGARYDFNGLESTTDEVLSRLERVRLQGTGLQEVAALLGDCDLVKFAKAVPSEEECERMIVGAVKIVRATTPGAAPAVAPAAQPAGGASAPAASKAEVAKAEVPKTEAPKAEVPQAEVPKAEVPKAEVPKAEAPQAEVPQAEVPKAEVPKAEAPQAEVPKAEVPVTRESPLMRASASATAPVPAPTSAPVATIPGFPTTLAPPPASAPAISRASIVLPLALGSADAIDPVVTAAVLGTADARASDPDFDGIIVVALGASLPDEYASRQALRAVHAKLTAALAERTTASGARMRVAIEHTHESPRAAAELGREPRKTVYAAEPGDRATPTGNAFEGS